jgi:hypothetical protein
LRCGSLLGAALVAAAFGACAGPAAPPAGGDAGRGAGVEADAASVVFSPDAGRRDAEGRGAAPAVFQVRLNADGQTSVCRGACVQLTARAEQGVPPYSYIFDHELGQGATHQVCPMEDTTYHVSASDASFDTELGTRSAAASQALTIRVLDCSAADAAAGVDAGAPNSAAQDAAAPDASGGADASAGMPRQPKVLCAKPIATIDARAGGSFDLWNEEFATKVAVDRSGQARVATTLTGTARVTNGPTLTSGEVLVRSLLVAKVDLDCTPLWATLVHGFVEAFEPIVAVDSQGRTILFARTKTEDTVGGTIWVDSLYLASLSADGALLWEKRVQAAAGDPPQRALRVDANDDIVIMSAAQAGSDFGGGPMGAADVPGAVVTVLAKYRPSGAHVWSKLLQHGATGSSLAVHNGTDILLHGWSDTALDWGAAGRTSGSAQAGQGHGYLVRADANGSFVWSKVVSDGATPLFRGHSLDALPSNQLVLGEFPGDNQLSVTTLDGATVWSQPVVGPGFAGSTWNETAVDAQGNIILSGSFDDSTRIRGVTLSTSDLSVGAAFAQKLDALGRTVWTFSSDTVLNDPSGSESLLGAVPDSQGDVLVLVNAFYAKQNALHITKVAH